MEKRLSAFTLVELSIVLVILGLLVGGVLSGQSLIRAAELRAVTTEFNRYQTALNAFKDKYFALPGDMPNAVRYWGLAPGGSSSADGPNTACSALTVASTTTATCNGNGDGQIQEAANIARGVETFRAWQHLANAGLVEGTFTGIRANHSGFPPEAWIGENVPRSKMSNAGWTLTSLLSFDDCAIQSSSPYNTTRVHLLFGANDEQDPTCGNVLKPEEAYNIDMKIDDGKPLTGAAYGSCVTSGAYPLSDSTVSCSMAFLTGS